MSPETVVTDSTAVKVRLSKDQVSMIWPGLNYIIGQNMAREQSGQLVTCYPFVVQPLPPGFDSGTYSAQMMDRIRQCRAKIQPIRTTGGAVCLDEFELRAAIFSARTAVNLERYGIRLDRKKGTDAKRRVADAKRALKKKALRKKRVVEFLERALKRANRLFKSAVGPERSASQSKEWQSHLKWIEFHLTYFKPVPRPGTGRLERRRAWLDTLEQIAKAAIVDQGYELPDPEKLRAVLRQFLDYSLRGRIGEYNHRFMAANKDSSVAQLKLLDFVEERLVLIMEKPDNEPKKEKQAHAQAGVAANPNWESQETAHRIAASKPGVQERINRLRSRWRDADEEECREGVADLLKDGCTVDGLAEDIDDTVRYYSKAGPDSPEKEKPKVLQAPVSVTDGINRMAAVAPKAEQRCAPSKGPSAGTGVRAAGSGKHLKMLLPTRPRKLGEKALPDDEDPEKEKTLESLTRELSQIIVRFVREKLGPPDTPARMEEIRGLLGTLRTYATRPFAWNQPRQLSDPISMSRLYQLTRPDFRKEQLDASELGKWLVVVLASLANGAKPWTREIDKAERELFS
jgi:hypothetical protein